MADMNIRNVPGEELRRFKARAATEGLSLREWVLSILLRPEGQIESHQSAQPAEAKKAKRKESRCPASVPARVSAAKEECPMKACSHGLLIHEGCSDGE